eukprot:TRINITY_DN68408_c0_g1_i1.p1 TRINITY_DN68408_c0_g1~~TRINITY_DN68408_c0_g1_i1.p1  ORF type:complete len:385 (+),score=62.66 TRINITY_DN68408_c0_g1_i1:167-1156(+)
MVEDSPRVPCPLPPRPLERAGSVASTTMRRRVVQSAALGEWDEVRAAVDEEGCNPNIQDEEAGLSIVHWAAFQGEEVRLRWLLDIGAFPRLKDSRGKTALDGAKGGCVDLLLQRAYNASERVIYARSPPTVARLEQELGGADVSVINEPLWDEGGASLVLALAARHGSTFGGSDATLDVVPLISWLKDRGANLEAVDEEGNGVLHMVEWGCGADVVLPLVSWLLQDGGISQKNARNRDWNTPGLLSASESPSGEDALRCLQAFEAAGVNLAIGNKEGMNVAMVLAYYHGDGPWIAWCENVAGISPIAVCAKRKTVSDYLALHLTETAGE